MRILPYIKSFVVVGFRLLIIFWIVAYQTKVTLTLAFDLGLWPILYRLYFCPSYASWTTAYTIGPLKSWEADVSHTNFYSQWPLRIQHWQLMTPWNQVCYHGADPLLGVPFDSTGLRLGTSCKDGWPRLADPRPIQEEGTSPKWHQSKGRTGTLWQAEIHQGATELQPGKRNQGYS